MSDVRASVALCTYQGAPYLQEQLESIARQTRYPDEVVVSDDGSTDGTIELLERFGASAPFEVWIHRNRETLGSTGNFEKTIGQCRGDVIFLSDQDDVWHPEKVEVSLAMLQDRPEQGGVFTNAELMDDRGFGLGRLMWETLGFGDERRQRFREGGAVDVLLEGNVVTGTTMAFRSRFRDVLLPIPRDWVQDAWMALVLGCVSELGLISDPMVRYRIHAGQQIGIPFPPGGPGPVAAAARVAMRRADVVRRMRTNERDALAIQAANFDVLARRLSQHAAAFPPRAGVLEQLEGKARHFEARARMPTERRRWPMVARELRTGRYGRYSSGIPAAVKDLLLLDRGAPPVILEDAWATTQTPTVIFLHMPGTGGSTVREFLRKQFGTRVFDQLPRGEEAVAAEIRAVERSSRPNDPHVTARQDNLKYLRGVSSSQLRRYRVVMGHFWFGLHEFLEPQPWTYVTILRDPVDRVLSIYLERVRQGLDLPLERWVEDGVDHLLWDEQTRRLAPPAGVEADVRFEPCSDEMLDRAKEALARDFVVVGVTERFDESLVLVARALRLSRPRYSSLNVRGGGAARQGLSETVLRRIEDMNRHDMELHRFATNLLEDRLRSDPSVGREAARLRRRNALYRRSRAIARALRGREGGSR